MTQQITFKALFAPFSQKKRKNWTDGAITLLPKNIAILKDSSNTELARCKLPGNMSLTVRYPPACIASV
jgi:hypothetical protein